MNTRNPMTSWARKRETNETERDNGKRRREKVKKDGGKE
jgi:hypothetical protein